MFVVIKISVEIFLIDDLRKMEPQQLFPDTVVPTNKL